MKRVPFIPVPTFIVLVSIIIFSSCQSKPQETASEETADTTTVDNPFANAISKPLVSHIFTADPSPMFSTIESISTLHTITKRVFHKMIWEVILQ